jgi:hypothetical protein
MRAGVDSIEHGDADPGILRGLAQRQTVISMTAAVVPGATAPYPARRVRQRQRVPRPA